MNNDVNVQKKASFWYLIANIMQKGAYLILIPLYTRVLSAEDYGIYTVSDSWVEILLVIVSLNLFQNTYSVAVKKYDNRTAVSSAFCGISLVCVGICLAVILAGNSFFSRLFDVNLKILIAFLIYLMANPIVMIWCTMKRYYYEYRGLIIVTVVKCFFIIGLGASILLVENNKVETAIYAKSISELIIAVYAFSDIYKKNHALYNREYWKFALRMGVPLIPYYLSLRILQHLDRIMINYIDGAVSAAKYGLIYKVTSAIMMINSSLNNAFLPWLYSNYEKSKKKILNDVYVKIVFLIYSINALLSLMAPEIVKILGTNEYADAIYVMAPLAMSAVFIFIYDQCVNIELYYEKNKLNSIFAVFISMLNALLNWFFIGKFGYIAAGYTTFVSYFVYMLLHVIYVKFLTKDLEAIEIFKSKDIVMFGLMSFLTIGVANLSYDCLIIRVFVIVLEVGILFYIGQKMNLKPKIIKSK